MCLSLWFKAHYQVLVGMVVCQLQCLFFCVCTLCTLQYKLTSLMWAAVGGHTDVAQVLLSRQDVDINMRDEVC